MDNFLLSYINAFCIYCSHTLQFKSRLHPKGFFTSSHVTNTISRPKMQPECIESIFDVPVFSLEK